MSNIDQIIKELYEIDPTLKEHDAVIRKIIAEFMAKKPDTKFDKAFAARLRARLIEEAKNASAVEQKPIPSPYWNLQRSFTVLGSVLLAVLILVVFLPNGAPAPGEGQHFTTEGSHSFGDLAFGTGASGRQGVALESGNNSVSENTAAAPSAPAPTPMSMTASDVSIPVGEGVSGAGIVAGLPAAQGTAQAGGMGGGATGKALIYPGSITEYTYTYVGDDFELTDTTGSVYSRIKGSKAGLAAALQLKDFGLGLIGLNTFGSARLGSFELSEEKADGYRISVNLDEGAISIYPNYPKWTLYDGRNMQPLAQSDALSDEKIIAIAEAFMKTHGIDRSIYGDAIVQNNQLVPMPLGMEASSAGSAGVADTVEAVPQTMAAPADMPVGAPEPAPEVTPISVDSTTGNTAMPAPFVAENVAVIFPLKINGNTVYEEGGMPFGLQVNVSVRSKKVESVYNLFSQDYTKSSYDLITDRAKLLEIIRAQNGMNNFYRPEGVRVMTVEIKLGTPEHVLMHHYEYTGTEDKELFVPALMFPVENAAAAQPYYYPKAILVPLVEDFLRNNNPQPIIMY